MLGDPFRERPMTRLIEARLVVSSLTAAPDNADRNACP
jgi:hypothetical protein